MGDEVVSTQSLEEFRNKGIEQGYSPRTIESTVAVIVHVLAHSGVSIPIGERLRRPRPNPDVPTIEQMEALYQHAHVAGWPTKMLPSQRTKWWRCWMVVAGWTALRISDLAALQRSQFSDGILRIDAEKTVRFGRPSLAMPIPDFVTRHIEECPARHPERLFGLTECLRQLRRELQAIAKAAAVHYVPPHGFRRYAITQWGEVDGYAAALVQGQALGALSSYLHGLRVLQRHAKKVSVPSSWLTTEEQASRKCSETKLLYAYRLANPETQDLVLRMIERIH